MHRFIRTCLSIPLLAWPALVAAQQAPPVAGDPAAEPQLPAIEPNVRELPAMLLDLLDEDGDGEASDTETVRAVTAFLRLGNSRKREDRPHRELLDTNGDGRVDRLEAEMAVAEARIQLGGLGAKTEGLFQELDLDRDQQITWQEYSVLVAKYQQIAQVYEAEFKQRFLQMDRNRDGRITILEAQLTADVFAATEKQEAESTRDAQVWAAAGQLFAALDNNRNKRISKREAQGAVEQHFTQIDLNLNNQLTIAELYDYMLELRKQQDAQAPTNSAITPLRNPKRLNTW